MRQMAPILTNLSSEFIPTAAENTSIASHQYCFFYAGQACHPAWPAKVCKAYAGCQATVDQHKPGLTNFIQSGHHVSMLLAQEQIFRSDLKITRYNTRLHFCEMKLAKCMEIRKCTNITIYTYIYTFS